MGYILPINHYQYNDYQIRRNRLEQKGTKTVDQTFKVVLEKQHENVRNEYQRFHENLPKPSPRVLSNRKGEHFDALI